MAVGEIQGEIVKGKQLKSQYRQRRSPGDKPSWKLFEDRVWLLLHQFKFAELSGTETFFIDVGNRDLSERLEIDVFGRADDNVFAIECKTAEEAASRDMRGVITRLAHYRSRILAAVRSYYDDKEIKVSLIIATKNIEWKESDLAEAHRSNIFVWTERQIDFLEDLAALDKLIGDAARYQLYAIMFPKQQIKQLEVREPALQGRIGKKQYYSFLTTPEHLLRIAYVHHRQGFDPEALKAIPQTYQRMLKPSKLKQINKFISDGNFFPNSIILSFSAPPRFDLDSSRSLETHYGTLYLPNRYRSAWIIDGQHRLYGYARNDRRKTAHIPVIAFVGLKPSEQAKLFVEINENQTKVDKNLLWDLASDIYQESDDPMQTIDLHIANVVKNLDLLDISSLKDHVYVPSFGKKSARRNVTMTTLCGGIKRTRLLSPQALGRFGTERVEFERFAAERLIAFFRVISSALAEDWDRGDKGYVRSNNGIAALLIVFQHVLKYYNNIDSDRTYLKSKVVDFESTLGDLLRPLIKHLQNTQERKKLKEQLGAKGQADSANIMCLAIRLELDNFPMPRPVVPNLPKDVANAKEHEVSEEIKQTELYLRKFVSEKLREKYGNDWLEKGIPGDKRDPNSPLGKIVSLYQKQLEKLPYRSAEYQKDPGKLMEFSEIGMLQQIIIRKENWDLFKSTFAKPSNVEKYFVDFHELRNVVQGHYRTLDEVVWHSGRAAIIWIRKCLAEWIADMPDEVG